MLNDFFASVFVHEGDDPIPDFNASFDSVLNDINITVDDMFKLLNSLKTSKSPGPDGMNPIILKESAKELAYPFKLLFDVSMKSGKIPSK